MGSTLTEKIFSAPEDLQYLKIGKIFRLHSFLAKQFPATRTGKVAAGVIFEYTLHARWRKIVMQSFVKFCV
jgi:hypothetical protein